VRAVVTAALAALVIVPAAAAEPASSSEVRSLAARAADDPGALARLRRIDVVDGRPMALRAALRGASGAQLERRLRVLASGTRAPEAHDARGEARAILAQRKYRGSEVPRPFHGLLVWVGEKVSAVGRAIDRLVPGPPLVAWLIVAGLVVLLASTLSTRTARRRAGRHLEGAAAVFHGREEDPRSLERAADEAERAGDVELALRLRFRAGLIRLARARAIPRRDSLTTGEVRRILRSPHFDRLAATFDEVVYGRRAAAREDVEAARADWPLVLEGARAQ
jgi:hypothetical protein